MTLFAMFYSGGHQNTVGDVRSRWSVPATRTFARSSREVELFVADAVERTVRAGAERLEPRRWRATFRRPFSMFDQREITIAVVDADAGSKIDIEVAFDASPARLGLVVGLTTSIVGIPLGVGWRWHSTRAARAEAKQLIDSLWGELDQRLAQQAYR